MSSQFTTQALSDYLSELSSTQSSLLSQNLEDQDLINSEKNLFSEQKDRGTELLASASVPALHLAYSIGSKVSNLAKSAVNFKNKVEAAGKQISELPEKAEEVGGKLTSKLSSIGEDAFSKLKKTASDKLGDVADEATDQGAAMAEEVQSSLGSIFENSRIGNMFGRIKQVFTPGDVQAKQLQEQAFEEDPEAGIRDVQPEQPKPVPEEPVMEAKPVEMAPEAAPELSSVAESATKDIGSVATDVGETVAKGAGEAVGEAAAETAASFVPGIGEVLDAGLLLYQGIEGLRDLFHHPSAPPPPPVVNEAQPTFQAGI